MGQNPYGIAPTYGGVEPLEYTLSEEEELPRAPRSRQERPPGWVEVVVRRRLPRQVLVEHPNEDIAWIPTRDILEERPGPGSTRFHLRGRTLDVLGW
jgi:hypothetical protein